MRRRGGEGCQAGGRRGDSRRVVGEEEAIRGGGVMSTQARRALTNRGGQRRAQRGPAASPLGAWDCAARVAHLLPGTPARQRPLSPLGACLVSACAAAAAWSGRRRSVCKERTA